MTITKTQPFAQYLIEAKRFVCFGLDKTLIHLVPFQVNPTRPASSCNQWLNLKIRIQTCLINQPTSYLLLFIHFFCCCLHSNISSDIFLRLIPWNVHLAENNTTATWIVLVQRIIMGKTHARIIRISQTIIACKWLLINCYVYVNVYTFVNLMHQTGNACVYCESVWEKVNKNEIKITQSHFILFLLIFFFFFFYLHVCVNNWFYLSSFIFWLHAFWYRSFESTPNAGLFLFFFLLL